MGRTNICFMYNEFYMLLQQYFGGFRPAFQMCWDFTSFEDCRYLWDGRLIQNGVEIDFRIRLIE